MKSQMPDRVQPTPATGRDAHHHPQDETREEIFEDIERFYKPQFVKVKAREALKRFVASVSFSWSETPAE